ncbi:6765_t:CDS:2 [Paraglomus brasilianum]|uniref:6765_t:CDS:1 n=1 Tax=Paraglomus brasilianum TaxID=144538 RepID=A0A9N9BR56_9GLOM|nr:6765_t:CDS:2 [Paraglomus brasilianum]
MGDIFAGANYFHQHGICPSLMKIKILAKKYDEMRNSFGNTQCYCLASAKQTKKERAMSGGVRREIELRLKENPLQIPKYFLRIILLDLNLSNWTLVMIDYLSIPFGASFEHGSLSNYGNQNCKEYSEHASNGPCHLPSGSYPMITLFHSQRQHVLIDDDQ